MVVLLEDLAGKKRGRSWSQQQQRRPTKRLNALDVPAWGRFRLIGGSDRFGRFWVSENMVREAADDTRSRTFAILRYVLGDGYGYQLFYRSSGHNSVAPGTWFPCDGFMLSKERIEGDAWGSFKAVGAFVKLTQTVFSRGMRENRDLVRAIIGLGHPRLTTEKEVLDSLLRRFGTERFLHASCVIGGGVWDDERMSDVIMNDLDITGLSRRAPVPITMARVLPRPTDLNVFARHAVSTNYCREEYVHGTTAYVDLSKWMRGDVIPIGTQSGMNKTLRRLRSQPVVCMRSIPVLISGAPHIIEDFYNFDLDTMDCNVFDGIKKTFDKIIDSGRIYI